MVDVVNTAITKIYENQSLTVTARIEKSDAGTIEEVTFKFLKDGEQFEEKTVAMSTGKDEGGYTIVSHAVKAPAVADDKSCYFLDYHYFYKVKNPDASTETLQNFPANRIQVFPRAAQLKVTDKDGKAFPAFEFRVEQDGKLSDVRKTFASDTPNAKGETVSAGSCEFNLDLFAGFRIVPAPPYQIIEEVTGTGRKREIKGSIGFRARFVAPGGGAPVRQLVNHDVESQGQTGVGHAVTVEIGVHPEDMQYLHGIEKPEVHFRVTYGPVAGSAVEKSARDDSAHPTKVTKANASDSAVTIEEKEAKKKYQGKVVLADGAGKFVVGLGKAGGDTCKVEVSGSATFLTNASMPADDTLEFENWRHVHYEAMVPDLMLRQSGKSSWSLEAESQGWLDKLGRDLFIEFVHDKTHVFNTVAGADYGTLVPKRFLGAAADSEDVAYVLSGRNWRKLPAGQAWKEEHPGKSVYIAVCDEIYKWRQDTDDEKAGTKDFSGTLKEAAGLINVEEKFEGAFMPFSGHDAGEGVAGIHWSADISKDDAVCKCKPALTIKDERYDAVIATGLGVTLDLGEGLPALAERVVFKRLPYPVLEIVDKTEAAGDEEKDDGKLTLKEPALGKELALEFDVPEDEAAEEEADEGSEEESKADDDETENGGLIRIPFDASEDDDDSKEDESEEGGDSFSDFGEIPADSDESDKDAAASGEAPVVTDEHAGKIDDFFKTLFKDGKAKLGASEEANRFVIEVHGGKGEDHRVRRIAQVRRAVSEAYTRTYGHDQYDFKKDLGAEDTARIKGFVTALLADKAALGGVKGKATVVVACPNDAKHGVDDCFKAVKDKLKELFDADAKEFAAHPGLDPDKDFAPREGDLSLAAITNVPKSSVKQWSFELPAVLADGMPGPGSFVGPEKTALNCPVKFELSFQPHLASQGEADGKLIAWACGDADAGKYLPSLLLKAFQGTEDKACLEHGHGKEGDPGQCIIDDGALCAKCIAHGRSRNLSVI